MKNLFSFLLALAFLKDLRLQCSLPIACLLCAIISVPASAQRVTLDDAIIAVFEGNSSKVTEIRDKADFFFTTNGYSNGSKVAILRIGISDTSKDAMSSETGEWYELNSKHTCYISYVKENDHELYILNNPQNPSHLTCGAIFAKDSETGPSIIIPVSDANNAIYKTIRIAYIPIDSFNKIKTIFQNAFMSKQFQVLTPR